MQGSPPRSSGREAKQAGRKVKAVGSRPGERGPTTHARRAVVRRGADVAARILRQRTQPRETVSRKVEGVP